MGIFILRPGAIGDTLLTFPILQHLQRKYGQAITFVGNASVLPLIQAFGLAQTVANYEEPQWGHLFLPLTNPPSRYATRLQAMMQDVDMAIFWVRTPEADLMENARKLGIKQIFVSPGRPTEDRPIHIIDYLAQSINEHIPVDAAWQVPEQYSWQASSPPDDSRAIAIHPGSGGVQKCWPIASFADLIKRLWRQEVPVLLLAGPADHKRIAELYTQLPEPAYPSLLNTIIDAPLLTVARHLQACRSYIGNDSGITHLSALLGVPTLALFGPSNPEIWRPPGSHVTVLHEPVLANLSVDAVQFQALNLK